MLGWAAALLYRGLLHVSRGDRQAIDDFTSARRVAERVGDRFRAYLVEFSERLALTLSGEPARGRGCWRRAWASSRRSVAGSSSVCLDPSDATR